MTYFEKTDDCAVCGNSFTTNTHSKQTCSEDCRGRYIVEQDKKRYATQPVDCLECNQPFQPSTFHKQICSDRCAEARSKRIEAEYRAANREEINANARRLYALNKEDRQAKAKARKTPEERERINAKARLNYSQRGRIQKRMKIYGLTLEKATEIEDQKKCDICNEEKELHVDHCHTTNKFRGMLCNSCNNGLGRFRDNIEYLKEATKYLERFNNE